MKIENELSFQRVGMGMTRWMCGVTVADRFTCNDLRDQDQMIYDIQ